MKKILFLTVLLLNLNISYSQNSVLKANYALELSIEYHQAQKWDTACLLAKYAIRNNAYQAHNFYFDFLESSTKTGIDSNISIAALNALEAGMPIDIILKNENLKTSFSQIKKIYTDSSHLFNSYYKVDSALLKIIIELQLKDRERAKFTKGQEIISLDSINRIKFMEAVNIYGFPTQKTIGYTNMFKVNILLQHFFASFLNEQETWLKLVQNQILKGDYDPYEYATMIDRDLGYLHNYKIRYGSIMGFVDGKKIIKDTENIEEVDEVRRRIGMGPLMEFIEINKIKIIPEGYKQEKLDVLFLKLFESDDFGYTQ